MSIASNLTFMLLFLWVAPLILEVFLARTRSKIPGLILPGLSFIVSLIGVLNIAAVGQSIMQNIFVLMMTFLLGNIMTVILLVIYFLCRRRMDRQHQLDKMNIQYRYQKAPPAPLKGQEVLLNYSREKRVCIIL